jgi:hypothetical protein
VACRRNQTGVEKLDKRREAYWLHAVGPEARANLAQGDAGLRTASTHGAERAAEELLDRAYRIVLAQLRLDDAHRANLEGARGLTAGEVLRRGYRTLPVQGRAALARALVEQLGEHVAAGVPGMHQVERDGRCWWSFGGTAGLVVPCRSARGWIVALKVRRDDAGDGPRYTYVSSSRHGGPGAVNAVHVPLYDAAGGGHPEVRVTEGELKADVCTALSGILTLSVPGVGAWASALPVLQTLGARRVRIAFDADHATKPEVGRALGLLVEGVRALGWEARVERWDPALGKGLDDLLATRARKRVA